MTDTSTSGAKAGSPYLDLPKRSEAEVRRAMREHQDYVLGAITDMLKPTPAQRWLSSDHVTKTLEKFRKEDGE